MAIIAFDYAIAYEVPKMENTHNFGLSGAVNFNSHESDLRALPVVPDSVPYYADGTSTGMSIGMFYEYPLTQKLWLFGGLRYEMHKAKLEGRSQTEAGPLNHIIDVDLSGIYLDPMLKFIIWDKLSLMGGLTVGYVLSKEYDVSRTDISDIVTKEKAELNSALGIALTGGLSYEIPLNANGQYALSLDILYSSGFADVGSDFTWDINSFRPGISFRYSPTPVCFPVIHRIDEKIDTIRVEVKSHEEEDFVSGAPSIIIDTLMTETELNIREKIVRTDTVFYSLEPAPVISKISAEKMKRTTDLQLQVYGIQEEGSKDLTEIEIEEFQASNMPPLLNYIFFDHNSATLPYRYIKLDENKRQSFRINNITDLTTLSVYHNILNIIGSRLTQYPDAQLSLTGCNSNIEEETGNTGLSKARAGSVKEYLCTIWNIAPERISVITRSLPANPSSETSEDGIAENRRVEISSDDNRVLAPVINEDISKVAKPFQWLVTTKFSGDDEPESWKLVLRQAADILKIMSGEGRPPDNIQLLASDERMKLPTDNSQPVTISMLIDIDDEQLISNEVRVPVNYVSLQQKKLNKAGDKRIDKYSLILFDFDSDRLSEANSDIIDFINSRLSSNSKIYIQGYSDRSGDETYNRNLSLRRARAAAAALHGKISSTVGLGEELLIYDNNYPEGRFYCRTVRIRVETSVK